MERAPLPSPPRSCLAGRGATSAMVGGSRCAQLIPVHPHVVGVGGSAGFSRLQPASASGWEKRPDIRCRGEVLKLKRRKRRAPLPTTSGCAQLILRRSLTVDFSPCAVFTRLRPGSSLRIQPYAYEQNTLLRKHRCRPALVAHLRRRAEVVQTGFSRPIPFCLLWHE